MGAQSVGKNGAAGAGRRIMERVSHHSRVALEFFSCDGGQSRYPSWDDSGRSGHANANVALSVAFL